MRVRYVSESRIFWSLGRGDGDLTLGVEVSSVGGRIRRTVFSRGKFGRESIVFEEAYSAEEYLEVLRAEETLTLGIAPPGEGQERAKRLLLEAIERLRRVYNGL